tara:strand:+ start:568 stop:1281 length:714 start_codon:yes stop_codon:yes gene_type:complete
MIKLIKFFLELFDYFTEKKILLEIKKIFSNKSQISIIDVGAHKGEYILNILKNFKVKQGYCFEPNPSVFRILQNNIKNKKNIEFINFGVSNSSGKIKFNVNIESSSSSINNLNEKSNYYKKKFYLLNFLNTSNVTKVIDIEVLTLDNFMKKKGIIQIDLLKIDTEGYEMQVLKGLQDKIKKIKLIHFEHHFDDMIMKDYKLSNIHNYLVKNGFKKKFKIKMKFRKSFEYLYLNKDFT